MKSQYSLNTSGFNQSRLDEINNEKFVDPEFQTSSNTRAGRRSRLASPMKGGDAGDVIMISEASALNMNLVQQKLEKVRLDQSPEPGIRTQASTANNSKVKSPQKNK